MSQRDRVLNVAIVVAAILAVLLSALAVVVTG